ncbi:amidohydrolase family-domain-containing protein [Mycena leptocephala]|nr:amidohydrolase family-domain-containing protein [Mycena leptocephala]
MSRAAVPDALSRPKSSTDPHTPPPSTRATPTSVAVFVFSVVLSIFAVDYSGTFSSSSPSTHAGIMHSDNSQVDCLVVNDSFITATGSLATTKLLSDVPIFYIPKNAIVVPGLSDSHGHILEYGASRQLPLEGTATIGATVARVRERLHSGGGWDHTSWPGSAWPTANDLDADPIIRGRPVVLQSKDCHALWVSARVLQLSEPFPPSVEGGVILTDDSGAPTGVLLDNAQELLKTPPLTEDDLVQRFKLAMDDALAYGLTSIHDAGLDPTSLDFFVRQAARAAIPIRIYGMRFFDENVPYWGNTSTPLIGAHDGRLTARSVKIFADGMSWLISVQLYEPYTDNPSTNGFMRLSSEVLFEFIPRFLRDGWQVNVHAIGDRANGIVLDAFEASLMGVNVTALRPRLEHAQLMTKADMQRLGSLGVIASVQPTHACGPERVKGLYAFRSLIDSGARITLGSDFPVETMNPLAGFYAAITRVSIAGDSPHGPDGWFPEERLTREEALRGMTIDPAYASFAEDVLGSLEPGKRADFTILSRDIMKIPVKDILEVQILATVIDGAAAYGGFSFI